MTIIVIGGGLAGCEAALQLAKRGFKVDLFEMKPIKKSPAHSMDTLCELVCSNSLKSTKPDTAGGLLKLEMDILGCELLKFASDCAVPAGGALAVDRDEFSKAVTKAIENEPNINIVHKIVTDIPNSPCIIATGPLTEDSFAKAIKKRFDSLYFFDAASPIISKDSINMDIVYRANRYEDIGSGDYLNCPMNKEEYEAFYTELINANTVELHGFETARVFESCMPVEVMAKRGRDTLRFGPLRPVGLTDLRTGKRPYAVVQLRQEDVYGNSYNLVGFQTNLKFPEQKRVFSMIPGLENAEFLRYGVMHANTYLNSPKYLDEFFRVKGESNLYFAGQITGVDGYVESIFSGMMAGINMARTLEGKDLNPLPKECITGALCKHVAGGSGSSSYQPMNANFGIIIPLGKRIKDKKERYMEQSKRSVSILKENRGKYF